MNLFGHILKENIKLEIKTYFLSRLKTPKGRQEVLTLLVNSCKPQGKDSYDHCVIFVNEIIQEILKEQSDIDNTLTITE